MVGVSFDQALYNFLGFLCYSTFNCALFFSPHVRRAYRWVPLLLFIASVSVGIHHSSTCGL